jgi:hypothetical protein
MKNSTVDTKLRYPSHNTLRSNQPIGVARITYQHHPFCGQEVEIFEIGGGRHPHVYARLPDDRFCRLAINWTDLEQPPKEGSQAVNIALVDIDGLLRVAEMLGYLKRRMTEAENASNYAPPPSTGTSS